MAAAAASAWRSSCDNVRNHQFSFTKRKMWCDALVLSDNVSRQVGSKMQVKIPSGLYLTQFHRFFCQNNFLLRWNAVNNYKSGTLHFLNRRFHEKMNFEIFLSKSSKAGKFERCHLPVTHLPVKLNFITLNFTKVMVIKNSNPFRFTVLETALCR